MKKLVKIARKDIDTSMLLLNNQIFHNSIYFYQQAVEKALKYVGLEIGVVNENDLRKKVSHNSIKIFSILDKKENLFGGKGLENFESLIKQTDDESLVHGVLKAIDESMEALYETDDSISYFQNFKNYIKDKDIPEKNELLNIEENDYYNKMAEDFFSQLNIGSVILRILFLNSCLCTKYNLDAYRYSTKEIPDPIEYFSETNSIISNLHIFIKSINLCLSQIDKINWNNKNYTIS